MTDRGHIGDSLRLLSPMSPKNKETWETFGRHVSNVSMPFLQIKPTQPPAIGAWKGKAPRFEAAGAEGDIRSWRKRVSKASAQNQVGPPEMVPWRSRCLVVPLAGRARGADASAE